jgi:5,10-methylenetetrahydromethanopterin reductase
MELWTLTTSSVGRVVQQATAAEAAGWDGMAVVDSQNLAGDSYVALTLAAAATSRLGLGTGVTNPVTRHPAVTAAAALGVDEASGGRMTLGIGRGDSSLAHLGRAPARVGVLERYLAVLQAYLRGESVAFEDLAFHERLAPPVEELGLADRPDSSRLAFVRPDTRKVPVEVASTGPRVIAAAARHADRVLLALGADPDRLGWGVDQVRRARHEAGLDPDGVAVGAYVNLVCHDDVAVARSLVVGGLSTFARFSVMHGDVTGPATDEQREVLSGLGRSYDMKTHTRADSAQADLLPPSFVDRYAIVGPPDHCRARLADLEGMGLDKLVVIGPTAGVDRDRAREAAALLAAEILAA